MPTPIKLTNAQLESVSQGLAALDGLQTKDGFTPYKFDDDTTWSIAVKTVAVQAGLVVLSAAKKSLAKQNGLMDGMKITQEQLPAAAAFAESVDALMVRPAEIGVLEPLKRESLNTTKNAIPPGVLAKLLPILE
jgi:hypothetical protein